MEIKQQLKSEWEAVLIMSDATGSSPSLFTHYFNQICIPHIYTHIYIKVCIVYIDVCIKKEVCKGVFGCVCCAAQTAE